MKKRTFIGAILVIGLILNLFTTVMVFAQDKSELDQYGGWKKIQFKPTGFFRVDKTDQRYWLVTPEGNAFITNGMNHVEMVWMQRFYNIDFWARQWGQTIYADHKLKPGFEQKVKKDMETLGINTLGIHSPIRYYKKPFMPYVLRMRFVENHHYKKKHTKADFVDVFSDDFVRFCEEKAEKMIAPYKDDPFLLGYALTDCPILTDYEAQPHGDNIYGWERGATPTWPQVLRNLGAKHPGKKQYVKKMKSLYQKDIKAFNQTYNTSFKNFKALQKAVDWRTIMDMDNALEVRDNLEFLYIVLDKCYEVEAKVIRKYDPNHLILGDKLNGNTDTPAEIYAIAGKHFDVIFIQYYAYWDNLEKLLDRIAQVTDKPIIHGDASVNVPNKNMPSPFGPHCKDQFERVEVYKELYYNAFSRPDFIGWHWCGYMDSYDIGGQHGKQHGGVQDPFGNWYVIKDAMKVFSDSLYYVAGGALK